MRASSLGCVATVTDPSGRNPTAGATDAVASHSSRARRPSSSSSPPARPLTHTRPKLRTDARLGPASASSWRTSQPRRVPSRACMVPMTPPPTMTTRCRSTPTMIPRGAARPSPSPAALKGDAHGPVADVATPPPDPGR